MNCLGLCHMTGRAVSEPQAGCLPPGVLLQPLRGPSVRAGRLFVLMFLVGGGASTDRLGHRALADEPQHGFIEVRNAKKLPAKIACSRIALGKQGDYKPCIARLPNGELLIVAFDASHKKIKGGFREDMLLWRSTDGGRTWSKRQVVPLLGREPYFSVLKDGTLLVTVHFLKQDVRNKEGYVYSLLHRSTDGGRTWQSTKIGWEDVPRAAEKSWIFTSRNVLELRDGTLIFGVSAPRGIAYLWKSRDGGKSWDKSLACHFEGVDRSRLWWPFMGETVFWQARNGDLLGLFSCRYR